MELWAYLVQGFTQPGQIEIIVKIILSSILGFLIGWNRRSTSAGIRTFSLITLGSTLFTIIALMGFPTSENSEAARIIAQIVSGVGFIGAGVIWETRTDLMGLTTAACIWVSAGIGIAVGVGMFSLAVLGTLLIIIILLLKPVLSRFK